MLGGDGVTDEGSVCPDSPAADSLASLPSDCLLHIIKSLNLGSLAACATACSTLRGLCAAQSVWKHRFKADFCTAGAASRLSSHELGGSAVAAAGSGYSEQAKEEDAQRLLGLERAATDWTTLYRRRCEVDRCWRAGDCSARVLDGHNDFIRCAQLEGSTLVTASGSISHTDCTIRVWDLDTGRPRQLLRGHMGPIWCMVYDPASGRVASGSDDYTVRYWDAQAGNCVMLQDPDSAVRCVHMDRSGGGRLVAGTEFGKLLMWDTQDLDDLELAVAEPGRAMKQVLVEHQAADLGRLKCRNIGRPVGGPSRSPSEKACQLVPWCFGTPLIQICSLPVCQNLFVAPSSSASAGSESARRLQATLCR